MDQVNGMCEQYGWNDMNLIKLYEMQIKEIPLKKKVIFDV